MTARWMTGDYAGRPFLECLCTNLDIWAIGLRTAGGTAQLVTTYPALPRGIDRVDIVLPGVANLTGLVVTRGTGRRHPSRSPDPGPRRSALDVRREATTARVEQRRVADAAARSASWPLRPAVDRLTTLTR